MAKKNYTKFSAPREENAEVAEVVAEAVEADETVEKSESKKPVIGIVIDCCRLNVRKAASKDADIMCIVNASVDLEIDESASTKDFYKVRLPDGREGFCMKKFVTIKP